MRGRFIWVITSIVSLLLFPSCARKQKVEKKQQSVATVDFNYIDQQKEAILEKIIYQEAMLTNIPIPLYDKRILPDSLDFFEHDATTILGYSSSLDSSFIVDFFMNQMERYGWKHLVSFDHKDMILIFENPDSYCLIKIKPQPRQGTSFFVYIKKSEHDCSLTGNELG